MPRISVIVPVYNSEKYLPACIDAILAQTFSDFELILVDDKSPDSCGKICDEYAKKDSRVRSLHHESNMGPTAAWKTGIEESRGALIATSDGDDLTHSKWLEKMYDCLIENDADIAQCARCDMSQDGVPEDRHRWEELPCVIGSREALERLFTPPGNDYILVWNKLCKREVWNGVFVPPLCTRFPDAGISYLLFHNAKKIAIQGEALYFWRHNSASIMHTFSPEHLLDRQLFRSKWISFMLANGYTRFLKKELADFWARCYTNMDIFCGSTDATREKAEYIRARFKEYLLQTFRYTDYPVAEKMRMIAFAYTPQLLYKYQKKRYSKTTED